MDVGGGKKAIIIFVPYRLLRSYHKIQTRLVRELEKKFRSAPCRRFKQVLSLLFAMLVVLSRFYCNCYCLYCLTVVSQVLRSYCIIRNPYGIRQGLSDMENYRLWHGLVCALHEAAQTNGSRGDIRESCALSGAIASRSLHDNYSNDCVGTVVHIYPYSSRFFSSRPACFDSRRGVLLVLSMFSYLKKKSSHRVVAASCWRSLALVALRVAIRARFWARLEVAALMAS